MLLARILIQINKPIIIAEDTVEEKKRIDILVYEKGVRYCL